MTPVREAARVLARAGEVEITQKGAVVDPDGQWRGPIRIRATRAGSGTSIGE
jgi:DNA-binding FadR family transcriptional regulator